MLPRGVFDETALAAGWFDETAQAANGKFAFDTSPQIGDAIYAYSCIPRALGTSELTGISPNPWQVFAP